MYKLFLTFSGQNELKGMLRITINNNDSVVIFDYIEPLCTCLTLYRLFKESVFIQYCLLYQFA